MAFTYLLRSKRRSSRGFTLIELAIVLGIVGVLAAGLYRLLSTSSQQTKDQATAQQQLTLINAVTGYLADTSATGGQIWMTNSLGVSGAVGNLPLPTSNNNITDCQTNIAGGATGLFAAFCNYLPANFKQSTTNPYGQTYSIQVREDSVVVSGGGSTHTPQTYSFMVKTSGSAVPDTDGGRIASLIGADGGFIYQAAVCTPTPSASVACGTLGAWSFDVTLPSTYDFPGLSTASGNIASRTYIPAGSNGSNYWLARQIVPGDYFGNYGYNTMATHLFMKPGSDIFMYPDDNINQPPLPLTGSGTTNNIHLWDGALVVDDIALSPPNAAGSIQLNTGTLTFGGAGIGGTSALIGGGSGEVGALNIIAPKPKFGDTFFSGPLIQLSTGIDLTTGKGCTFLNSAAVAEGCPQTSVYIAGVLTPVVTPAINILAGDINVSNGQVEALKILSASDMRLKTHIRPIEDPLASLMHIDAVAFALKNGGSESMGVTAQNLEKTYPQLVSDVGGRKYVDYNGLIGPLIGAVQELKKQNDDLRSELASQKAREDRLEGVLNKKDPTP